jgi:signal transduction histidine kinase
MTNLFSKSYYKYKIIITFSIVTILLVAVLANVSYNFMNKFYLNELSNNVKKTTLLTSMQIDTTYLSSVQSGLITKTTKQYFNKLFNNKNLNNIYSEIFVFDKNLYVIIHSDTTKLLGKQEPRLLLNEQEILNLHLGKAITSLPFKGNDNNWYLWGFIKLTDNYWLAVRESAKNFEQLDQLSNLIWYFGLGGIALSVLLGFIVANSITKPITKLVAFSNAIGKGNFKAKIPKGMKGELKTLAKAMDLMRSNIDNNQKEKEKILAQIAHEIRNPLGGIELLINLINESADSIKNKDYTKRVLNEINGLKELITSYLNYSKPSPAIEEVINLTNIIDESLLIFAKEIKEKNISVEKDIKLKTIIFDKNHLRNILLNLIKNSIDSITKNGKIIINTYNDKTANYISIQDNGTGIEEGNLSKIFEPFFTTKTNGTGLGLASCKKFCDENNAQLKVKTLEQGSVFIISKENKND